MHVRVVDAYDTVADSGYREQMPLLHVIGRDTSWQRQHVVVDAFRPYFCVRQSEWRELGEEVAADDRVLDVRTADRRGRPEQALDGERLVRIVCREPSDVGDLREVFADPHEADVRFPVRFLVDLDVFQWITVPDDACTGVGYDETDDAISVDEILLDVDTPETAPPPRVCTYDIEVQQGGTGPPVVSEEGCEQTRNPITAIAAHDSYTDEFVLWVLAHQTWTTDDADALRGAVPDDVLVNVYSNPRTVVGKFLTWVTDREMDVLTGWNASGFDHPYLVNYALNNDVSSVWSLSPTNDIYPLDGDGKWINSSLKGRLLLDTKTMYEKTAVHELDSYRLADVAAAEDVSVGKLDIEDAVDVPDDEPAIDYAWREHPDVFAEYSLRDVQACVGINRESKEEVYIV